MHSKLRNNGGAVRSRDDFRHSFETGVHNQFREIISDPKSNKYIPGQSVQTSFGTSFPTIDRIEKLEHEIQILITRENSVFQFLHVLGLMASCIEIVPFARLHIRPIQLHWLSIWKPVSKDMLIRIPVTKHLIRHLKWWLVRANTLKGRSLQPYMTVSITTDSSKTGYGGHLEGRKIFQGTWSKAESKRHINILELDAVLRTMTHFLPFLENRNVLVRSDNTTVV